MTYWRATRLKRSRRKRQKHVVFNLKQNTANIAVRVSGHYLTLPYNKYSVETHITSLHDFDV